MPVRRSRFVRRQAQSSQPKSPCEFDTRTSSRSRRSCELRDRRPRIPSLDEPLVKQQRRRSGNDLRETQHASAIQAPSKGPLALRGPGLYVRPQCLSNALSHTIFIHSRQRPGAIFSALRATTSGIGTIGNLARKLGVFKMLLRHKTLARNGFWSLRPGQSALGFDGWSAATRRTSSIYLTSLIFMTIAALHSLTGPVRNGKVLGGGAGAVRA